MSLKLLVLFAHPSIERSEANRPIAKQLRKSEHVTWVDLYARYPTFDIDVSREQQQLLEHDVIIFQHPLYWYSTPAILKEWQDLVLEHGFAYGAGGTALAGKLFFNIVTAGGSEAAYAPDGYNNYPLRELLRPLEQTANLCGMKFLPPFALFGARDAFDSDRGTNHASELITCVTALALGQLDIDAAAQLPLLNEAMSKATAAPLSTEETSAQ